MSENNLIIKKYPFLGYSTNIIEYFAIIGYNEKYIPNMLNNFKSEKKAIPPTVLSSITSNTDFGLVDNDLIIEQIYPENPEPILIKKTIKIIQIKGLLPKVILYILFALIQQMEKINYFIFVLLLNFMKNMYLRKQMKNIIFQKLFVLFLNIIILLFLNIFVKIYILLCLKNYPILFQ